MHDATMNQAVHHRVTIALVVIILSIPLVFFDTTAQMINVWNVNETFTHGYLIFPIALWLIWSKRHDYAGLPAEPELRPLLLLAMALVAWFLGRTVDVQVVQQVAMIGMIPVAIWLLLGRRILLAVLFPVLYLWFAVPIGQSLIPPMMDFTADFTIFLIRLSGIPVFRDGLFFTLPSGNWSVVEECSGVRYLIASLALGTIYAYISYRSMRKRLLFVLVAIIVPILANGLRAYGIVLTGHLSGMTLATGVDHLVYGWVFFGIIIFAMFYVGSFWADPAQARPEAPNTDSRFVPKEARSRFTLALCLAGGLIVAIQALVYLTGAPRQDDRATVELRLPGHFDAWEHIDRVDIGWHPIFQSPDLARESVYRFGDEFVQLNIAYYHHQRQGAEAISTQTRITNPLSGKWKLTRRVDLQINDQFVTETEIRSGENKILVWHWYRLGEKQTPNPYIAKLFEAYNKIVSGRHDAAMITIATPLSELETSRTRLEQFLAVSAKDINMELDGLSRR